MDWNVAGHPGASVRHAEHDILSWRKAPDFPAIVVVKLRCSCASTVSLPPSGIASRALIPRLMMADSRWLASASMCQRPALPTVSNLNTFTECTLQKFCGPLIKLLRLMASDQRLPARECEQSAGQRCRPLSAPYGVSQSVSKIFAAPAKWRLFRSAVSILPSTIIIRLLKSWAIPPLSCPTASIFWEAINCS